MRYLRENASADADKPKEDSVATVRVVEQKRNPVLVSQ